MARKSKDVVTYVDGVKVTQCAYRGPKKGQETFPVGKSRYTVWAQTASRYVRGSGACQGTIDQVS
jgi:hypothetical protein